MKRALFGATSVVALALLPMVHPPAALARQLGGTGAASFTDTITPSVDVSPRSTTHSFRPTLVGTVVAGDIAFAGTITTATAVSATSSSESTQGGSGTVSSFSFSGSGGVGTVTGTASGTWTRTGSVMLLQLAATVTVCNPAPSTCAMVSGSVFDLAGVWAPASATPPAAGTPIGFATFAGAFAFKGNANVAPNTPTLKSPPPGGGVNGGPGQLFTVQATDPDQEDVYTAEFEVTGPAPSTAVNSFKSGPTPSGHNATGTPTLPFAAGDYTWRARAVDNNGAPSSWSAWQSFRVVAPPNFGGGEVRGRVHFDDPGLPGATGACEDTTFQVLADPSGLPMSNSVVLNLAGTEYVGPLTITGLGDGDCSNAVAGAGTVNLHVEGEHPVTHARVYCESLLGKFARVGSYVTIVVSGSCQINAVVTGDVAFRSDLLFRPEDQPTPGNPPIIPGINARVHNGSFTGSFLVTPS